MAPEDSPAHTRAELLDRIRMLERRILQLESHATGGRDEEGADAATRIELARALEKLQNHIAERQAGEQALKDSHDRFLRLLNSLDAIVYVADMESHEVLFINERGREALGNVIGRTCWQVIQADQEGPCPFCTNEYLVDEHGQPTGVHRWEFQNTVNQRWYDCRDQAIVWVGGRLARLEIATDITERKQAEEALRVSEEKFKNLFSYYPHSTAYLSPTGEIIDCNRKFLELHGVAGDLSTVIGRSLMDFLPEGEHPRLRGLIADLVATGQGLEPSEFLLLREDGSSFVGEAWGTPILDDQGTPQGIIASARDLTEQRRLEEEQDRASKLESLGILAGGIAHDFNNILTGVFGSVELALLLTEPGSRAHHLLQEARKAATRATALTRQLLTFSRGGTPVKEVVSLADTVQETVRFALRGSNVRCDFRIAPDLPAVEVDVGQIGQVISNLVINADQAMPEGGIIRVTLGVEEIGSTPVLPLEAGRHLVLRIEDPGQGIPREHLTKIFDPYFSTKEHGSGLGLATAYSIIRKHGGCITVDSEPGAGSTFSIYLPVSREAVPREHGEPPPAVLRTGPALVMDDEEAVRDVLAHMLERLGFEVETVSDGVQAVASFERAMRAGQPFVVVIMDLTVPGGQGGKATIRELLQLDPGARVIVASGYSNDPVLSTYQEHGFSGVLRKPVVLADLTRVLGEALQE